MEDALRKILGILISLTIIIAANAHAGTPAGAATYRAEFDWVGAGSVTRRLELRVFDGESRAEIRDHGNIIALCRVSSLAAERVDLECKSPGLDRLAVVATLVPASSTLRFGNWLQGVDTVGLRVLENHVSRRVLAGLSSH